MALFKRKDKKNRPSELEGITLKRGKTYKALRDGYIRPGQYIVYGSGADDEAFNIRVGNFVREYKKGYSVVLAEGDEITSVSHTVVLR